MACTHEIEPAAHVEQRAFIGSILQMISFGDPNDNVHHIGETLTAGAALAELMVDLGRNDELPRLHIEKASDDLFDVAVSDDVAMTDEHGQGPWRLDDGAMLVGPAYS